jgi:hypothetical protein
VTGSALAYLGRPNYRLQTRAAGVIMSRRC